jgi:hypothetical protein
MGANKRVPSCGWRRGGNERDVRRKVKGVVGGRIQSVGAASGEVDGSGQKFEGK